MSPRQKLLNDKNLADQVSNLVNSSAFDTATDAAMLQLIEASEIPSSIEDAAQKYANLMGAKAYLKVLRTITDVPKRQSQGLPENLNFKA